LLVIFYTNKKSIQSGVITLLSNRFGDFLFLSLIILNLSFSNILIEGIYYYSINFIIIILICLTKRAQFCFSRWLLYAIAAPTPISALVHSRTLVTAGLYLVIKYFKYFSTNIFYLILSFIRMTTILISGITSLSEIDIKKLVALSTLRQIRLIFYSISINITSFSFCHILRHAFYKRVLFLNVGILIHENFSNQDFRFFNIRNNFVFLRLNVTILSLISLIFLRGWLSKELILEKFKIIKYSITILVVSYGILFFTVIYRIKLLKYQATIILLIRNKNKYFNRAIITLLVISTKFSKIFYWNIIKSYKIFYNITYKLLIVNILIIRYTIRLFKFKINVIISKIFFLNSLTTYFSFIFTILKYQIGIFEKNLIEVFQRKIFQFRSLNSFNITFINIILIRLIVIFFVWSLFKI